MNVAVFNYSLHNVRETCTVVHGSIAQKVVDCELRPVQCVKVLIRSRDYCQRGKESAKFGGKWDKKKKEEEERKNRASAVIIRCLRLQRTQSTRLLIATCRRKTYTM